MRIIAGAWRGLRLNGPGGAASKLQLRPTPDRLRERLFNMLQAGRWDHDIEGAHVLDLFAGTGALGLEALSRGAAHAMFVEKNRAAQHILASNIDKTRAGDAAQLLPCDALKLGPAPRAADLVFLDPPFGRNLGSQALERAASQGWLQQGALILWEEDTPQQAPPFFQECEVLGHATSQLTVLKYCGAR